MDPPQKVLRLKNGVKQGCVLAPTLCGIFFSLLLRYSFPVDTEGIYLNTRTDGKVYDLSRLRTKTKVRHVLIRELLYADDAARVTHTEHQLQKLIDCLCHVCMMFSLTISVKKTVVMETRYHNPAPDYTKQYSARSGEQIQLSRVYSD